MSEKLELLPSPDRPAPSILPPSVRRRRRGGTLVAWVVVLLVLGGLGVVGWQLLHRPPAATRAGQPPQSVGVATIGTGDLDVIRTGLGTVTPLATVTVKTQINGQLQQIAFTEGQIVHKGDFLFQIDPRPYQVALEQATGTLAHDQALLDQAKADFVRYQMLNRQDSISRQQVQDQEFLVKQDQGSVVTDQANVDSAKLNLVYCHITSPVDGKVGIRLVDLGNYVQTSDTTGLVVITQLQPMSVQFTLPEDDVMEVQAQMAQGPLPTQAFDRADRNAIATGTLATIDSQIDVTTGTIKLRSLFPNTDLKLFPQAFVNAHLRTQTLRGVVVAPLQAVQMGAPGSFVYLVKPDHTVAVTKVTEGVTQGNLVQITEGLKPGDVVVTDGLDRLRDGARINVVPPGGGGPAAEAPAGQGRPRRNQGGQSQP